MKASPVPDNARRQPAVSEEGAASRNVECVVETPLRFKLLVLWVRCSILSFCHPMDLQSSGCTRHRFSAPRGYHHGTNRRPSAGNVQQQLFFAADCGWLQESRIGIGVHKEEFSGSTQRRTRKDGPSSMDVAWRAVAASICFAGPSPVRRAAGTCMMSANPGIALICDSTHESCVCGCESDMARECHYSQTKRRKTGPAQHAPCNATVTCRCPWVHGGSSQWSQDQGRKCCTAPSRGSRSFFGFYLFPSPHTRARGGKQWRQGRQGRQGCCWRPTWRKEATEKQGRRRLSHA